MGKRETPALKDEPDDRAARRSFVSLPLAQLMPPITRVAFRARSPAGADLMANWDAIVGPRLAAQTIPRKLSRGQLTIACSGPVGMELQHAAASLIDRINTQSGTKLVERLRFIQAPVVRRPGRDVTPATEAAQPIETMAPGPLNDALASLRARLSATRKAAEAKRKKVLF